MQRLTLLACAACLALCAACGGGDDPLQLGRAVTQDGLWCPDDPAAFVGPLPLECLP